MFDFEEEANKAVDQEKTYRNIYDLVTMISKENRLYFDLSYVLPNGNHVNALARFFVWAKICKPIILERTIWGSDWPLIGYEKTLKNRKNNVFDSYNNFHLKFLKDLDEKFRKEDEDLHCYDQIGNLANELRIRFTFLNPIQFLGLSGKESGNVKSLLELYKEKSPLNLKKQMKLYKWETKLSALNIPINPKDTNYNIDKYKLFVEQDLFQKTTHV